MMMLNNILISNGGVITKWLQLVTKYSKYFYNTHSIMSFWHDILLTYKARPNKNEGNKRGLARFHDAPAEDNFLIQRENLRVI
jgi:hypothetical protein